MEELLRTRKLSSASARKRKIQERQVKLRESKQRTMDKRETKEFRYGYGYCSDEEELSDNEGTHNTFSPVVEGDLDPPAAIASPSTAGPATPDVLPSTPYPDTLQAWPDIDTRIENAEEFGAERCTKLDLPMEDEELRKVPTPTSAKPVLHSTLTSRADFAFDFYTPDLPVDDTLDLDTDLEIPDLEPETPIEIATPVLYSQPLTRPSVVSIYVKNSASSTSSQKSSAPPSISSPRPATYTPLSSKRPSIVSYHNTSSSIVSNHNTSSSIASRRSVAQNSSPSLRSVILPASYDRRSSTTSDSSGFPACEATPLDLSTPPVPPIRPDLLARASRESLLDGMDDRQASSHVKKPSVISSFRQSALNNIITSYVKDNRTSGRSRPTTARSDYEMDDDSVTRIYHEFVQHKNDYPPPLRPRTATNASSRSWGEGNVTALPTPPEPPLPSIGKSSTYDVARKKSLFVLRNRGSSIGKALRSASSSVVPTISTMHYPSRTGTSSSWSEAQSTIQARKGSMDLASFPIPPRSPYSGLRMPGRKSSSIDRDGFVWSKVEAR